MSCKKSVSFGSFNTRTLRQPHNLGEMTEAASRFNIDVICVQEHRIVHETDTDYTKVSGAATTGGIGLLMSHHTMKCLTEVKKYSDRILTASFTGNSATTIITIMSC